MKLYFTVYSLFALGLLTVTVWLSMGGPPTDPELRFMWLFFLLLCVIVWPFGLAQGYVEFHARQLELLRTKRGLEDEYLSSLR